MQIIQLKKEKHKQNHNVLVQRKHDEKFNERKEFNCFRIKPSKYATAKKQISNCSQTYSPNMSYNVTLTFALNKIVGNMRARIFYMQKGILVWQDGSKTYKKMKHWHKYDSRAIRINLMWFEHLNLVFILKLFNSF